MATPTPAIQSYVDHFGRLRAELPGGDLPWLAERRAAALEQFRATGFPTPRVEAWKYTPVRALEKLAFAPAPHHPGPIGVDALPSVMPAGQPSHHLVFVDGRYRPELSSPGRLPAGVTLASLAETLARAPDWLEAHLAQLGDPEGHPFLALNTAFLTDGAALHLARGVALEAPVELVFATLAAEPPVMVFPRLLLIAEAGSSATVVEHHLGVGGGTYLSDTVAEVVVAPGARLHHYKLQRESRDAFHVATLTARLERDATYDRFALTQGAGLARDEVRPVLAGPGADCRVNGAYMVNGTQHADTTSVIDHAQPHGTSRQVYKGVIDGRARAVFQGKIVVRPGAQKTDGYQINRALLLSDTAEIDSKPELEIYADDVKCSHGATAGELDTDQLFYLRARGLDLERARALLIGAFLAEAIEEIPVAPVRDSFQSTVDAWLAARGGEGTRA